MKPRRKTKLLSKRLSRQKRIHHERFIRDKVRQRLETIDARKKNGEKRTNIRQVRSPVETVDSQAALDDNVNKNIGNRCRRVFSENEIESSEEEFIPSISNETNCDLHQLRDEQSNDRSTQTDVDSLEGNEEISDRTQAIRCKSRSYNSASVSTSMTDSTFAVRSPSSLSLHNSDEDEVCEQERDEHSASLPPSNKRRRQLSAEVLEVVPERRRVAVFVENEEPLVEVQRVFRDILRNRIYRSSRTAQVIGNRDSELIPVEDVISRQEVAEEDAETLWSKLVQKTLQDIPDFFRSDEVRLKLTTNVQKGAPSYRSLLLTTLNCTDIEVVYSDCRLAKDLYRYRAAEKAIHGSIEYSESFKQLLCVAGQLMRWGIVRRKVKLYEGWKPHSLFRCIGDNDLVTTLVEHFRVRCAASTVNAKTIHLRTICRAAKSRCGDDFNQKDSLEIIYRYLTHAGSACKNFDRYERGLKRKSGEKESSGKILVPGDFSNFIKVAEDNLNSIIKSSIDDVIVNPRHNDWYIFSTSTDLLNKWCINFTSLLILLASGQRPQVFHQLQCPSMVQLESWNCSTYEKRYIALETISEKRGRSTDLPQVIIPKRIIKFLSFHVCTAREFIMKKTGIVDDIGDVPLLIHSRTGDYLDTRKVNSCLRSFLVDKDPGFRTMTTMSLRASYATMMFRAHRDKYIFPELTEAQFLEELGKMMNTSLTQLRETYIQCATADFHQTASSISMFLEDISREENRSIRDSNNGQQDVASFHENEIEARTIFY